MVRSCVPAYIEATPLMLNTQIKWIPVDNLLNFSISGTTLQDIPKLCWSESRRTHLNNNLITAYRLFTSPLMPFTNSCHGVYVVAKIFKMYTRLWKSSVLDLYCSILNLNFGRFVIFVYRRYIYWDNVACRHLVNSILFTMLLSYKIFKILLSVHF